MYKLSNPPEYMANIVCFVVIRCQSVFKSGYLAIFILISATRSVILVTCLKYTI